MVLLGTGTCQLTPERMASAVLLELEDLRVVYDFGRGIAGRITELGLAQDDIEHVVISHFHPDHLSDLIPFLHAGSWSQVDPRTRDLTIWGPTGLKALLEPLFALFSPGLVNQDRYRVHLREVADERLTIGDREFIYADLPPANNHGLKFSLGGRSYALTGDAELHEQSIEFLREVTIGVFDAGHLTDEEIVELAVESGAELLVASHLYRELDEEELNARASKRGYAGRLIVGHDLESFELGVSG